MNGIILFSTFYILGIVGFFTNTIPLVALLLLVVAIIFLFKEKISCKGAVLYYLAFALAICNCHFQIKNYDGLSAFIPSDAAITGTVETIPTTNVPVRTKFYLKAQSGEFDGVKVPKLDGRTIVTLYDTPQNISRIKISDKIQLKGKLRSPFSAKNPCQFDYANYLKNKKTFSTFYVQQGDWKIVSRPETLGAKFLQKLNDTRTRILNHQKKYMKSPNIEVLGGIVFGDDAINPPDLIKTSFINSGLLHILAASGMNVSIIFGIWYFIGTRLRLNYRFVILVGAVLVGFYTLMTGMGPSVLRAALMIEFVILGKLIDRAADSIALIFLVALLLLLYDPAMINDVGFQLSFVVTFALIYCVPPILDRIKNKPANFLAGAMLIPFVAQLWAAPIQMFYFNNFATYSVLANLAITPFIMLISFGGFLGSILAMIPVDFIADKVCLVFAFVLNPVVSFLVSISHFFAGLPNSLLTTIHPHSAQMILYYGALLLLARSMRRGFKEKKSLVASVILGIVLIVSLLLPVVKPLLSPVSKDCEIIVFDVGNADSFLIKTPKNKYIMIDTAHGIFKGSKATFSQANAIMGKYLKDKGIKELELMILTHFDADHSGGAVDIMKTANVKRLVLSKDKDDSKTTNAIMEYVKENNINTTDAKNNEVVHSENGLVLTTFTPDFTQNKSDNDNSTISLLSFGDFDMLFMADGGVRSFNKIKKDLNKTEIEVLKSGHHGAKNTVTSKMLNTIYAQNAVISTGLNPYGHPTKQTLKTLRKNNVRTYRTDVDNAMKITTDGKTYKIYRYNPEKRRFEKDIENPCK